MASTFSLDPCFNSDSLADMVAGSAREAGMRIFRNEWFYILIGVPALSPLTARQCGCPDSPP